ncbi:MAG: DUF779 domain-containing protein [Candidatus Dormibacteria bacterium]
MSDHTSAVVSTARVIATPAALQAIGRLEAERGALMFFQSGGCCDGSLPMCFDRGEFIVSDHDVLLGSVGGCPFYIDHRQFEAWKHTQLILDVEDGLPEGFSLPAGPSEHFVTNSRMFDPQGKPGDAFCRR